MKPQIKFTILTLFPEAVQPYLDTSMMWKAQAKKIAQFNYLNLRDFGLGPHKSVDDTPYGGGDGMLLRPEPIFAAIESAKAEDPDLKVILPTPVGQVWTQSLAREFATSSSSNSNSNSNSSSNPSSNPNPNPNSTKPPHYLIICPRYEGYDQRILSLVDYKISLGKYILTGGELPALIIIDSIVRLLPGVLGGAESASIESFSDGDNLEYPQYTKPADFRGMKVPDILLSGNHGAIQAWRDQQSGQASC